MTRDSKPRSLGLALIAVCGGYAITIFDSTGVNVALPAIGETFDVGLTTQQWVVAAYLTAFATLLLMGGQVSDAWGPQPAFRSGLILFAIGSAVAALAPSAYVLIAGTCLQGIGAALSVPASLALIQAAYTSRESRARAVGVWGGVAAVAACAGPALGGLIVTQSNWRFLFIANLGIALTAAAIVAKGWPTGPPRRNRGISLRRHMLTAAIVGTLVSGLIEFRGLSMSVSLLTLGCVVAMSTIALTHLGGAPLGIAALLRSSDVVLGATVGLLINFGFYGQLFVITIFLQESEALTAQATGLVLLPQMIAAVVGSSVSGLLSARWGAALPVMFIGLSSGAIGLFALGALGFERSLYAAVIPMIITGWGMSLTMPAATTAVLEGSPSHASGLASGLINASRQIGGVLGVSILGTILEGADGENLSASWLRITLAIAGGAFLLGGLWTGFRLACGFRLRRGD